MRRIHDGVRVLLFCGLLLTGGTASASMMQRQILDAGINLGWAAETVVFQGKTPQNMAYLTGRMNDAAAHVREIMRLLAPPYLDLNLSPILDSIVNWDSGTAAMSASHAAAYFASIYERLRSVISVYVDPRTNRPASDANCDRHFAEVGFFFGRANIAALQRDWARMNQFLTAMRQAYYAGLSQDDLKACGFGRLSDWQGLPVFNGDTSENGFVVTREQIEAIAFAASGGILPDPGWSGRWTTSWGNMVLVVSGSRVTGTYEFENGRISGTIRGNVLEGTWVQDNRPQGGPFRWQLSRDGRSWTGQWRYAGDTDWKGSWTGSR